MKVFNEDAYIEAALRQAVQIADHVLVIEGVDRYMAASIGPDRVTDEGLSADGTTEIIESFPDPEGKIEHIKLGFYDEEEESFQRMLLGLKAGDILWTVGADEFFLRKYVDEAKQLLEEGNCLTMRCCFLTYWHDFRHLLRGGGWDNELARAWVLTEDGDKMSMVGKGATLCDSQGRDYNSTYYTGTTKIAPALIHHMSYVRTPQKIMEKICWQLRIEDRWDEVTEDSPVRPAGIDSWTAKQRYKTPENFVSRTFPWFTNVHDRRYNIRVEDWNGPWPEVLEGHPYWDLHWDGEPVIWRP